MIDNYEVVKKLVGKINPIGETNTDDKRFNNLKEMCALIEKLLTLIAELHQYENNQQYSIKRSGMYAIKFYDNLGIKE